ncbi:MAG: alpha-glucosidase/alpha-galactosidase [Clostridia bacterium]|nr:alpha-glucosidase/alpha-galactosidase [Clostridia bacterium]
MKVTIMGAGSTVFSKNVMGDIMLTPTLRECEIALYDIDGQRLDESMLVAESLNSSLNENRAVIKKYLGVENRKDALRGADFVVNTIQVGLYDPCTILDFEIPKKFGLRQTIGDTLGIGGIFRGLRTIHVLKDFAADMEEVCPNAWFLNYTNPMAILSGYMQRYTNVKTVGLCHSVQVVAKRCMEHLGMDYSTHGHSLVAGINHMAWLLEIYDKDGNDLYPEIRERAKTVNNEKHNDMVRMDYLNNFGYYVTESSEHNAEYNPFYIKSKYPELIERFNIPLDEYPRRCVKQIEGWEKRKNEILAGNGVQHPKRTGEYASYIMESILDNKPYTIGGNVQNNGLITNLPANACVEVPCLVNGNGIQPTYVGALPPVLAAMNMTNINVQLLTIEAAVTMKKEAIYHAAMLEPHTAAELSIDDIKAMCDELYDAHIAAGYPVF